VRTSSYRTEKPASREQTMEKPEITAKLLFGEVLDLPREQRSAFLDRACRGTPELRRAVEALLAKNDRLSRFLSDPLEEKAADPPADGGPTLAVGARLGRYSIREQLGSGGMGVVYRAQDEKLERTVAIKMLRPGTLAGHEARRQFRREALALAKLNHSHIAAVYDVGDQDGIDYIVMEFVPGESLAARIGRSALEIREATTIASQVADALAEAHENGVIHRDLKPANVMITPKGVAKVLDFGLAKLRASADATLSLAETRGLVGTPSYMSPEQAAGKTVDARTDLWSLGVLYFEALTGRTPFHGESILTVLRSIAEETAPPLRELRPEAPAQAERLVERALTKDPARRYQTAAEMARDASDLLSQMSGAIPLANEPNKPLRRWITAAVVVALLAGGAASAWLYRQAAGRRWAKEEAIPQIARLIDLRTPLAAVLVLDKAEKYLPSDSQLQQISNDNTQTVSIVSEPSGAQVEIEDYLTPNAEFYRLGTTPLNNVRIPKGYFRWRISKPGLGEMIVAPATSAKMEFSLAAALKAPRGMVYGAGGNWGEYIAFIGWTGPYKFPAYYIDRYEVTNGEYQQFVDSGGYSKEQFWPSQFQQNGRSVPWSDGMLQFRDATGRPGPSTWSGGHYPEGQADFPVSGVSWFEAAAYATYAGKTLPVMGQWYQAAPPHEAEYTLQDSNITSNALAQVGTYKGIGAYGTYDMAGNVREWVQNAADGDLRFILGGSWKSPSYLYSNPEALSPFDRSDGNGFRCVLNLGTIPEAAARPVVRIARDFSSYKPVSDEVFSAYKLLYAYGKTALNAKVEGVMKETVDWREEKVTFDTAYGGERMTAYLFLPKRVRPPYQTILFFPSARVMFLPPNSSELGDVNFFDYILQSGRAVVYPVYQDTYERRVKFNLPGGSASIQLTSEWCKDAARSLDYLATRPDIDSKDIAYLGVSMGSADGVIFATLLQDRLKTAIFLDGGYFLQQPPPGGDQADFAPRMKKPVLMVNGRYDYTFPLEKAQNPLFQMLGTPAAQKSHVVLDTPHDVTEQRPQLVKAVLDWLDRYLGRVGESNQ
jgi:serine/threonine protein kinase/dienelactone hydrolase